MALMSGYKKVACSDAVSAIAVLLGIADFDRAFAL